jgi:K(+)-stimulated pyrophosphate-energized sodium pump
MSRNGAGRAPKANACSSGPSGRTLPGIVSRLLSLPLVVLLSLVSVSAFAQGEAGASAGGGEAALVVPNLTNDAAVWAGKTPPTFLGMSGHNILMIGILVCLLGMAFGWIVARQLRSAPVHPSMLEMSELIYETCKTYLLQQAKFLAALWALIAVVIVIYFGGFSHMPAAHVLLILFFSIIGIGGSTAVAAFGMRVNTYANSRAAFASLKGKPFPCYAIPLKSGMSVGMLLISIELIIMLAILLFVPGELAGKCFIGFAIGESLGASALRIAGGIFTKIADIGSDLMKIVFKIKEDDARNPGVIADCTGDNAGDSVGPSADGFETYGVTGVALISFILLAIKDPTIQVQLLVWIFVMRIVMVVTSAAAYWLNDTFLAKPRYLNADEFNSEKPLTSLVWVTSILSIVLTFVFSKLLIGEIGNDTTMWWKLSAIITCGTLAGAIIPELVKIFTSTESGHVKEVVNSAREGGASLDILSGFVAGNFSAHWMGVVVIALMGTAYLVSMQGLNTIIPDLGNPPIAICTVFAFGLVAFGFLGMGPVTIAVDSYGPVTDNAQSIYELSMIETLPGIEKDLKDNYGFDVDFEKAKHNLEANDGAGNTFKATAKPVLIGTAVVGATTMIFSIIVMLTQSLTQNVDKLSLLNPLFLFGLIAGGAVIYWFTGAATQAVSTGAYRAVEFIKANIHLENVEKASVADSKKVVQICTQYAQKGMINIFLVVFCSTLAFACLNSFFFVGYLIAIAIFGLFQALFMANAGGAWDNAKKIVEVELKEKGTPLHDATVVGDTVGDPFKDTSSVAMNPIIKFTTLFGLLAVELAETLKPEMRIGAAAVLYAIAVVFVYRSFYHMRIETGITAEEASAATK